MFMVLGLLLSHLAKGALRAKDYPVPWESSSWAGQRSCFALDAETAHLAARRAV
jgi:hypothetical protein